ncbi:MAG: peptidoglycan-binding domain-containing protein [Christensenellales bacterium]
MTAQQLVEFAEKALTEKWGYVLSAQGEMYSLATAEYWAKTRNKPSAFAGTAYSYYVEACARWFGHFVADCSGLIIAAFRSIVPKYQDQKADTLFSRCTETGTIKTIPEIPGLIVWKKGHIGVFVGGGYVIEARGYKYGVVKTKVSGRPWTHWGKLKDIIYESEVDIMINKSSSAAVIKAWQTALIDAGFQEGMDVKLLGQWGSRTEAATKAFQKAHGVPQTGYVDGATAAAMFGKSGDAQLQSEIKALKGKIDAIKKIVE